MQPGKIARICGRMSDALMTNSDPAVLSVCGIFPSKAKSVQLFPDIKS